MMNWYDLTIKQAKAVTDLKSDDYDDLTYTVKVIAIITDKQEEEVMNMPIDDIKKQAAKIDFYYEQLTPKLPSEKYKVNGKKYVLTMNANNMTTEQYIDYTNTLNNEPENFALLCAVLLIPEKKKYKEGYDIKELAKEFEEHFKIADVMNISAFFQEAFNTLTKTIINSSTKRLKKEIKKGTNPEKAKLIQEAINHIQKHGNTWKA